MLRTSKHSIFQEFRADKSDVEVPERKTRENHSERSKKSGDLTGIHIISSWLEDESV